MTPQRLLPIALLLGLALPAALLAHCDTLDGPVVTAARAALAKGDVTPVLKWVRAEDETEVRSAFQLTLSARASGGAAKEIADRWFYETVVRLHRAGEGEPYTGLKPAGAEAGPAILAADRALESGSADALVRLLTDRAAAGIRESFRDALEASRSADRSVDEGRRFVRAYVEFIHYAERVYDSAGREAPAVHHRE